MKPPSHQAKKESKKVDYLREWRLVREERAWDEGINEDDMPHPQYDWKSLQGKDEIDHISKAQLLKQKARTIEEGAYRREQYLRCTGDDAVSGEKINDRLIDAIEAKLAILDGI